MSTLQDIDSLNIAWKSKPVDTFVDTTTALENAFAGND